MTEATEARPIEQAKSLLVNMLARIREARAAPLCFEIDTERVVTAARSTVHVEVEPLLLATLNELVGRALGAECFHLPAASPADWLADLHRRMNGVHPLAIDMLGLLVEGDTARDVAARLGFGLRLTQRILAEMRGAGEAAP